MKQDSAQEYRSPSRQAFTLIELLISLSIMGILFGVGIAKYNDFNRRQIVTQAALELKSNLRLIQNKASSGEKDCAKDVCGGTTEGCNNDNDSSEKSLDGWYISFPNDHSYIIYGKCGNTPFPSPSKIVDLSSKNIKITWNVSPIRFKPLAQGLDFGNDAIDNAEITLTGFGFSQQVFVSKTGEIK